MLQTFSLDKLERMNITKGELFKGLEGVFDYALPQGWLDHFSEWCKVNAPRLTYGWITFTTVWSYGKGDLLGGPVSACNEVHTAIVEFYRRELL